MKFRSLLLAALTIGAGAPGAGARTLSTVPLDHVLELARPYPNLVVQIRLQLVRAGLKREQVTCTAEPVPPRWSGLQGRGIAPYTCPIGKQRLTITATTAFLDVSGRRITSAEPAQAARATEVRETGLKWRWR